MRDRKIHQTIRETGFVPGMISIIAPCYNEEESIPAFLQAVAAVDLSPYRHEILVVNDGSRDASGILLEEMKGIYPQLQVIHFVRNFGQQQALMAGIRSARGEILVTMDIDLQQPPALIPEMIRGYKSGYEVVYGIPVYEQASASALKRVTSRSYYALLRRMSGSSVVPGANDFRLMSHRVAEVLRSMPERNLYLRGMIADLCPIVEYESDPHPKEASTNGEKNNERIWKATIVPYIRRPRMVGRTKYSALKMMKLALDGMTATGIRPLRYGLHLGVLSIFFAFGLLVWVLYIHTIVGRTVPGWSSLMVVVLFFSSIQFILIGLLGEYIGKIFLQVRGRPGYLISAETTMDPVPDPSTCPSTHQRKDIDRPPAKEKNNLIKSKVGRETLHPP